MTRSLLILGGSASGKSTYAVRRAADLGGDRVTFVATARHGEAELDRRIEVHQQERPKVWGLVEAGDDLGAAIRSAPIEHVLLVDSLTLWVAGSAEPDWSAVADALRSRRTPSVLVSDEVGSGVVPEHPAGRAFRDALGRVNQRAAETVDEVVLVVAGLPLWLKR